MRSLRLPVVVTAMLLLGPTGTTAQQLVGISPPSSAPASGTMLGAVLRGGDPLSRASVRLRDVASGRILSRTVANEHGEFTFADIPPGRYVAELVAEDEGVLSYGEVFGLLPGQTVVTVVDASKQRRAQRRQTSSASGTGHVARRGSKKFWMAAAALAWGTVIAGTISSDR